MMEDDEGNTTLGFRVLMRTLEDIEKLDEPLTKVDLVSSFVVFFILSVLFPLVFCRLLPFSVECFANFSCTSLFFSHFSSSWILLSSFRLLFPLWFCLKPISSNKRMKEACESFINHVLEINQTSFLSELCFG